MRLADLFSLTFTFHSRHIFLRPRHIGTPRKFTATLEDYQRVLKELSDEEALEAVNSASDVDESGFIDVMIIKPTQKLTQIFLNLLKLRRHIKFLLNTTIFPMLKMMSAI
ncbi:hypothetical protein AVEN_75265-1 [Araneus ventricosus]|uniref:Uncharacterized protein n=1 Tax=Araneus ventricosus TaxID=182803 RepID=A0A4Y2INR7_ARAVE|nr:hypothetical protein AVEN_75265-1 [Araneus ventricosus]